MEDNDVFSRVVLPEGCFNFKKLSLKFTFYPEFYFKNPHSGIEPCYILDKFKKQSSGGVLSKRCSSKFLKIHRKIPLPDSLFK